MTTTPDTVPERTTPLPTGLAERLARQVTAAADRPRQQTFSPFDGSPVGEVPTCTAADVEEAVRRARAAQREWAQRPLADRVAVLRRYHDLLLAR